MNELTTVEGEESQAGALAASTSSRAAQEVQAAMIVAKRFPRDVTAAIARIETSCKRKSLAEVSQYQYQKGGSKIVGPSIRLAETMAQAWGNLDFGVVELETRRGESTIQAYCWDLETNTRSTKVFTVAHKRHTRSGGYDLTDPREIYENNANSAARRMRACILAVIPGDVVDHAVDTCNKTLLGASDEPLIDRVRKMVVVFGEQAVTQEMLETRLGHKIDATSIHQLVELGRIYRSIKDGMSTREQWFTTGEAASSLDDLAEKLSEPKTNRTEGKAEELSRQQPEPEQKSEIEAGLFPESPETGEVLPPTIAQQNEWDDAMRRARTPGGVDKIIKEIDKHPGINPTMRGAYVSAAISFKTKLEQKGKSK